MIHVNESLNLSEFNQLEWERSKDNTLRAYRLIMRARTGCVPINTINTYVCVLCTLASASLSLSPCHKSTLWHLVSPSMQCCVGVLVCYLPNLPFTALRFTIVRPRTKFTLGVLNYA